MILNVQAFTKSHQYQTPMIKLHPLVSIAERIGGQPHQQRLLRVDNEKDDDPPSGPTILDSLKEEINRYRKPPPINIEDMNLLLYDLFLIVTVSVSSSFWVVHRMDASFLGGAFNEGCLMSIMWIISGLFNGAFLWGAVDGHFGSSDPRGGPKAAGLLGFHTYIGAVNLRLLFALIVAMIQHRSVGSVGGELLIPLEIGAGIAIISSWRFLHSLYVPRI